MDSGHGAKNILTPVQILQEESAAAGTLQSCPRYPWGSLSLFCQLCVFTVTSFSWTLLREVDLSCNLPYH